jgi:hypothetical protein
LSAKLVELGPSAAQGAGILEGWGMQLSYVELVPRSKGQRSQQGMDPAWSWAQSGSRGDNPTWVGIQKGSRGRGPGEAGMQLSYLELVPRRSQGEGIPVGCGSGYSTQSWSPAWFEGPDAQGTGILAEHGSSAELGPSTAQGSEPGRELLCRPMGWVLGKPAVLFIDHGMKKTSMI